jgi:hypothetical protein
LGSGQEDIFQISAQVLESVNQAKINIEAMPMKNIFVSYSFKHLSNTEKFSPLQISGKIAKN